MLANAADGVASLGALIRVGLAAFLILAVIAVFVDGSSMHLIRRVREQRKEGAHSAEAPQVNRLGDTSRR